MELLHRILKLNLFIGGEGNKRRRSGDEDNDTSGSDDEDLFESPEADTAGVYELFCLCIEFLLIGINLNRLEQVY